MRAQNGGVSLYRVYSGDTPIHPEKSDTPGDTAADTPSLKTLALNYLYKGKAIRPATQEPIQQPKKCITRERGSDTLFEAQNKGGHRPDEGENIDLPINGVDNPDTPTPEQVAYRDRLLVACPSTPGVKWHVWYCSRCAKAGGCGAWRHLAWEVAWYRGAPVSALAGAEVLQ